MVISKKKFDDNRNKTIVETNKQKRSDLLYRRVKVFHTHESKTFLFAEKNPQSETKKNRSNHF